MSLVYNVPVIIRLKAENFDGLTKGFDKPFDKVVYDAMFDTVKVLILYVIGCSFLYMHLDEMVIVLDRFDKGYWQGYDTQKICSVTGGMAAVAFNRAFESRANILDENRYIRDGCIVFSAEVLNMAGSDIGGYLCNCEKEYLRKSIVAVGKSRFSESTLEGRSISDIEDMCVNVGAGLDSFDKRFVRGVSLRKSGDSACCWEEHVGLYYKVLV